MLVTLSEFNTQCHRRYSMLLRHRTICKLFVCRAYLRIYLSNCLQILYTTPLGGLVVPLGWGVTELIMTYLDVLTYFLSREDCENYCVPNCTCIGLLLCLSGFGVLGPKGYCRSLSVQAPTALATAPTSSNRLNS